MYTSNNDDRVKFLLSKLPEDFKNRASSIQDLFTQAFWEWGALANDVYSFSRQIADLTMEDAALATIILVGERYSIQRVCEFASVDAFYAPLKQNGEFLPEYNNLPFVIVEYAKTHKKNWKKVLDWVISQKIKSKPSSLAATRKKFEPDSPYNAQTPADEVLQYPVNSPSQEESSFRNDFSPEGFARSIRSQISRIEKTSPKKAFILSTIADLLDYVGNTPDDEITEDGTLGILMKRMAKAGK